MNIEQAASLILGKKVTPIFSPILPSHREMVSQVSIPQAPARRRRRLISKATFAQGLMSDPEIQVSFISAIEATMISFSLISRLEDEFEKLGLYKGAAKKYCEMARRAFQLWRARVFPDKQVEKILHFVNIHLADHLLEYRIYYHAQAYNHAASYGCQVPNLMAAHYACFEFASYAHATIQGTFHGNDVHTFSPVEMMRAIWSTIDGLCYQAEREVKWDESEALKQLRERMTNTIIQDAIAIRERMANTMVSEM